LEKSKRWFAVWFGLLSYTIAQSESMELQLVKDPVLARQTWKNVLVDQCAGVQIDSAWLDLLLDTTVASFSWHVWRTGTFIYITSGDRYERESRFQPEVDWFVKHAVPVWYRWDKEAASLPANQYLAPLEFQLQDADTCMRKSPSTPSPMDVSTSLVSSPIDTSTLVVADSVNVAAGKDCGDGPFSTVQMDAFFKLWDERTARLKENETVQQRACRLSRESQPPKVNTRVFEWTPNKDGEFVCEEIKIKQHRREIFEDYRGNQRRYNAVLNEWHLCVVWDHFKDKEDDDDDGDYVPIVFYGDNDPPPNSPANMHPYDNDNLIDDVWIPKEQEGSRKALQL